jgi:CheY-like chemotaxis protein
LLFSSTELCFGSSIGQSHGEHVLVKNQALQVLLVEDNSSDARLLREMFSKEKPGSFELTHVTHMREAEIRLSKGNVDIVLLDMGPPW